MSGAPFRELFVELPRAVFETLQGIGEQAVRKASEPPRRSTFGTIELNDAAQMICRRYGWRNCEVVRCAASRDFEIGVRLLCGHQLRYVIDDYALASAAHTIDAIDSAVQENPRFCHCVPKEIV